MKEFNNKECFIAFYTKLGYKHVIETKTNKAKEFLELQLPINKSIVFLPDKGYPRYGINITNSKAFPKDYVNFCIEQGKKILSTEF